MSFNFSGIILKYRLLFIALLVILTGFMAYRGKDVKLSYENSVLSEKDSSMIVYQEFRHRFGEDGNGMVIAIEDPRIFELDQFNAWFDLENDIRKINGVQGTLSMTRCVNLVKNEELHQFDIEPLIKERPTNQVEVDSLKNVIKGLKFYEGLIFNPKTDATLMMITLDRSKLTDENRTIMVNAIRDLSETYSSKTGVKVHYSGLPHINTVTMTKVKTELFIFVILSILVAAIILYFFFRSIKVVLSSMLVVGISILWVLGIIALFDYEITILTGVIPSLIVIIAIENCIYILNKYHWEYRIHQNKTKALRIAIQRIGVASLMTNTATALGFAAFIMVPSQILREFGVVTSISIMMEFVLCIILLPIVFSYLDPPSPKHTKHLDNGFFRSIVEKIIHTVSNRRRSVYIISAILLVVGIIGVMQMKTSGKLTDDFQSKDPITKDLVFLEKNFGGVMPFEISVDTKKKNGAMSLGNIAKIDKLQKVINSYPEFSKPLSIAELLKFSRQSYYGGDSSKYSLPSSMESNFILSYLPKNTEKGNADLLNSYIDSDRQITRISYHVADLRTKHLDSILAQINPQIDSIFPPEKYDVKITGHSIVYAKGTNFLINHLFESVTIAIVLISILMALLFSSFRMILISMIPNIIPLIITAAIMGFTGVPLKPSTIIIFSVALGISVDNAIQYLSRYRHELKITNGNIKLSAINALHEAGFSMIYTSIVLVLGFSVFIVSGFGGTQALGILISTSLFIAMFFNIIVLPSLLLSLDKRSTVKAFTKPIIEIYDGDDVNEELEEDITEKRDI
jgi:predicted RND superfamily exporter protein